MATKSLAEFETLKLELEDGSSTPSTR